MIKKYRFLRKEKLKELPRNWINWKNTENALQIGLRIYN